MPALKYLFTQQQMTPEQVIEEVAGLDYEQIKRIAGGETRDEILNGGPALEL